MSYPEQFGQPCWVKEKVDKCISSGVAQIQQEHADLFLSSHSPIDNITDQKAGKSVNEEEAFQSIFAYNGEFRGVVLGGVGTGKSHLIRWLNIRTEKAVKDEEDGFDRYKIVMVKRDTGNLRSALRQIAEQLGDEFEQLKKNIETTVDRFSDNTARQELLSNLHLEIGPKWVERGEQPLDEDLKDLPNVLLSEGLRDWFCRDGGVIAQTISRFKEKSSIEERLQQIEFTQEELPKAIHWNKERDTATAFKFLEDLQYDDVSPEETLKVLNKAFLNAKRELTGINANTLNEIFSEIRIKLKEQNKELVVFVEDVTVVSGGLDIDFFQAFEPVEKPNHCRMIALLGMTKVANWQVLADHDKDRVQMVLDIDTSTENWASDATKVAKFTARYLNTIRSEEDEIAKIASNRLGSDVNQSKCDACPHQIECFDSFGSVELEKGTKVGLFPLSNQAPAKLLRKLNIERHRQSPRGLLDYVLNVALSQSFDRFTQNQFPYDKNFNVQRTPPTNWSSIENKFLGGSSWNREQKERALFLTEFWFASGKPDEVASELNKYRKAFRIPVLSESPTAPDTRKTPSDKEGKTEIVEPRPPPTADNSNLQKELILLGEWLRGKTLQFDSTFRDHLKDFFKYAIKWEDYPEIPVRFAYEKVYGNKPHKIEGQESTQSTSNYFIDYPRNQETHDLLEALVRFKHEGRKSWNFDLGEMHKRKVARWLRNNRKRVLETLHPDPLELTEQSLRAGIQFLALTAVVRKGETLPKRDQAKRIAELFVKPEEGVAHALSNELNGQFEDIVGKWEKVKEFIVSELGIGQGSAAPTDYIDPLPILKNLEKFEKDIGVEPPDSKVNKSFWQKRFSAVSKLSSYDNLDEIFEKEKQLIDQRVAKLEEFSKEHGFDGDDLSENIKNCLNLILEIEEIQKASGNLKLPPERDYNSYLEMIAEKKSEFVNSVGKACGVNENSSKIDIIALDTEKLNEIYETLIYKVKSRLQTLESEMQSQLNTGQGDGDSVTKDDLIQELDKIITVIDPSDETQEGGAS
jgi:division protein CdvB (Snf7/Vps24/ESCRT-III family)